MTGPAVVKVLGDQEWHGLETGDKATFSKPLLDVQFLSVSLALLPRAGVHPEETY